MPSSPGTTTPEDPSGGLETAPFGTPMGQDSGPAPEPPCEAPGDPALTRWHMGA